MTVNFINEETLAQVFSCEFFKKKFTFFIKRYGGCFYKYSFHKMFQKVTNLRTIWLHLIWKRMELIRNKIHKSTKFCIDLLLTKMNLTLLSHVLICFCLNIVFSLSSVICNNFVVISINKKAYSKKPPDIRTLGDQLLILCFAINIRIFFNSKD